MNKKNKPIVEAFEERHGYSPPRFITISPTKKCNLSCIGCYAESSADCDVSLDWNTVDKIVQQQKDLWGSHFTVISGGEPMMWKSDGKNILDLVEKHSDTFFLMYTNGTLITEEVAERMGKLGNITPSISVEGFEEETDWRRGKGVHKKIRRAFERLRNAGVMFGISITATKNNAELVFSDEFIDYYFNKESVYYGWIFQYMPIGRAYSLELMPTAEQRFNMMRRMNQLIEDEGLFLADFWNSGPLCNGCLSAGRKGGYIYINWDGNVMPCVFNPYSTDNIVETFKAGGSLDTVIDSPFMKKIRAWQAEYYDTGGTDGDTGNMLAPCPMKDHHAEVRAIIDEVGAEPTDDPAEEALGDKAYYEGMVEYGKEIAGLTQKVWDEEYLGKNGSTAKKKEGVKSE
jgi:MoaA/NifB/PqqE/SkfB family radical SAM enzyme